MAARALQLPPQIEALRLRPDAPSGPVRIVSTGIADFDALLPDGGIPRAAVTELSAPEGLAHATALALALVARAQAEARLRGGASAMCAFLDPSRTLHGPYARVAGVDLAKMLVVRPPVQSLGRIASRVVGSRVFSVVVIDTGGVPGARLPLSLASWATLTRRLSLAAEGSDTAVVLLTHHEASRPLPLPVAMRVELSQPSAGVLMARVGKERRGLVGSFRRISLDATPSIGAGGTGAMDTGAA